MNAPALELLKRAVQANCDIADARHARGMTMCNYLLAMRDLFRWERDIPLASPLAQAELGAEPWVGSKTASFWPMLPEQPKPSPPTICAHRSEMMSP